MALVKMNGVSKVYQPGTSGETTALFDINLAIDDGEFVAVVGPSGSGKSTLMHLIGGLDTPTAGSYFFDGNELAQLNDEELCDIRRRIGFVFQDFRLVKRLTLQQNVELPMVLEGIPADERHERATEMLDQVGLHGRADSHPNDLSGGQQQRVAIARALTMKPRLLIADEPTGNLDTETGRRIMELFFELHRTGFTIILVTHDPNVGNTARRSITVQDGLIVGDAKSTTPHPRKWAQRPLRVSSASVFEKQNTAFIV